MCRLFCGYYISHPSVVHWRDTVHLRVPVALDASLKFPVEKERTVVQERERARLGGWQRAMLGGWKRKRLGVGRERGWRVERGRGWKVGRMRRWGAGRRGWEVRRGRTCWIVRGRCPLHSTRDWVTKGRGMVVKNWAMLNQIALYLQWGGPPHLLP